ARADGSALRALRVARGGRFSEPCPLGHALRLRGPSGEAMSDQRERSDALVFFGASGDLAYKKIFPALQSMVRRGRLNCPVIGVARSDWTVENLIERARASIAEHGDLDETAFAKLTGLLHYVDGDYNEDATFSRLYAELGGAKRPAFYLAIPPSMFPVVIGKLQASRCTAGARVI